MPERSKKLGQAETESRAAMHDYKRLSKTHLIVIDDIMIIDIARNEANAFFHFINALHEKTSFVITTNKSPKEWVETIGDEVITIAIVNRFEVATFGRTVS